MEWFIMVFVIVILRQNNSLQDEIHGMDNQTITEDGYQTHCPLSNFIVTIVFNNESGCVYPNLKLSWDRSQMDELVNIEVELSNNSNNCWSEHYVWNHSLLNNSIVMPNMVTDREVKPGCTYIITFKSETEEPIFCIYNYTVSENVHCDLSESLPEILSVEPITDNKYLVTWTNLSPPPERLSFKYTETNTAPNNTAKQAKLIRNHMENHISEVYMNLKRGEQYTLIATFEYGGSCSLNRTFGFRAPKRNYIMTIIICTFVIFIIIFIIWKHKTLLKYEKKLLTLLRPSTTRSNQEAQRQLVCAQIQGINMVTNLKYRCQGHVEEGFDEYEIPKNRIFLKEIIGSGAFGQVYSAKAIGINGSVGYRMVAVKTLGKAVTKEAAEDFIGEIEIFKKIGHHPNIVALLGCCTLDAPYMMIMEFVPCGDLKKYLVELREQWLKNCGTNKQAFFSSGTPESATSGQLELSTQSTCSTSTKLLTPSLADYTLDKVLDHRELQKFAIDIAKGMAHLEKIGVTHRDLAARNVLINESKVLKISDFGLSRRGPYINNKTKRLPLRWMAIEAVLEQKYDSKSDVWSSSVVLWEIGTLGAFPYESVPDSFIQQFLQLGRRLERPEICTDELFSLMRKCWCADPEQRPTFQELVDELDVQRREVYTDFSQLNPGYVFPPSDVKMSRNEKSESVF